ncbi:hypothetical protein KIW84_074477 [Lathyrus oleraceus]|uniref:Mitochondrial protein n=1 Tax=Pisum sativum TaxID=3888 RepID=A0A9D4VRE0_PEA|nr:hypothetical protein KIW84_074477 [Pisum sativum]
MVQGFKISKDENGIEMDGSFFKQLIGSMMYLTATRPNIMYAVSLLSRYYRSSSFGNQENSTLLARAADSRYFHQTAQIGAISGAKKETLSV